MKFRVWDIKNKTYKIDKGAYFIRSDGWLELQHASIGGTTSDGKTAYCSVNYPLSDWEYQIQYFTGLKDSVGKDIYEGDIIERLVERSSESRYKHIPLHDNEKRQVLPVKWGKYSDGEYVDTIECWTFNNDSLSELIYRSKYQKHEIISVYTVVGNVFENPELCEIEI